MANVFDQFDAPAPAGAAPAVQGNVFDQFDEPARPASFSDRFDAAPPMSRAEAAPRVGYGSAASIASNQAGADALFSGVRRTADEALVGKPSLENQIDAGLFRGANAIGLNAPRNLMAGIEALRSGRSFGDSYREVSDIEDALARQYPKTAAAGTVGGIVGGAVALPAVRAAQGAGFVGRMGANARPAAPTASWATSRTPRMSIRPARWACSAVGSAGSEAC